MVKILTMCKPSLLTIPVELIQCINEELNIEDTKQLRLTCKHFAETLSGSIFHTLSINITPETREKSLLQLSSLAGVADLSNEHDHPAQWEARILRILSLPNVSYASVGESADLEEIKHIEDEIRVCLLKAIASLKGIQEVSWVHDRLDREWASLAVLEALKGLPNLRKFHVVTSHCSLPVPFTSLKSLQAISFEAPMGDCIDSGKAMFDNLAKAISVFGPTGQLTSLDVSHKWHSFPSYGQNESIHSLFKYYPQGAAPMRLRHLGLKACFVTLDEAILPHLASLNSLKLSEIKDDYRIQDALPASSTSSHSSSDIEGIWTALTKAGIQLKEITTDFVTSSFLTYLSSYSGLRKLHISGPGGFDDNQSSDIMAQRFFGQALRPHAQSLEDFQIKAHYSGFWCFDEQNVSALSELTNLRNLGLRIISSQLWEKRHFKKKAAQAKPDTIELLLDTVVTHMPRLQALSISLATPAYRRGAKCGSSTPALDARLERQMIQNVGMYRAPPSCRYLPHWLQRACMHLIVSKQLVATRVPMLQVCCGMRVHSPKLRKGKARENEQGSFGKEA
ncbi:hypothetical protein CPB84DRAFT_1174903 [Gymnopilus junonius]|uniref:F-box domain-containing protein n=1 Tax=Gymnopilus junonius TaxID=109634 RepID=A0A9P5NN16_GYMJU|nr:hypothetical protein CPB84DRAFT_1174903 [Gymnopilus junonius]